MIQLIYKAILFSLIFLLAISGFAQTSDIIKTARPGKSFGQYTVGTRVLQLQGGVGYMNMENDEGEVNSIYENLVLRYGLKERIEISAAINHSSNRSNMMYEADKYNGINQFDLGFRVHLFERASGFSASWQTRARLYFVQSENFDHPDDIGYASIISLGYPIDNTRLVVNAGTTDTFPFIYTLNYSIGIGDSFSTFIELYGNYDDEFYNAINGGFAYLINKDLQLDLSGGIGLDDVEKSFFIEGGISYRVFTLK